MHFLVSSFSAALTRQCSLPLHLFPSLPIPRHPSPSLTIPHHPLPSLLNPPHPFPSLAIVELLTFPLPTLFYPYFIQFLQAVAQGLAALAL